MTHPDIEALDEVTEALYRAEAIRMQKILNEESRVRAALARLDIEHAANRGLPAADLDGLRQIGGDMIWQGWVGRKRADLQSELARVLARKGQIVGKLRRAFGKAQAVQRITATARAQRIRKAQARNADTTAHLAVLDRWMSG